MVYCCVPLCKSSKYTRNSTGVSFHELPSNDKLREIWLKNINRTNWQPVNREVVCSLHFQPDDFAPGLKRKRLKPMATPTVFKNINATEIQDDICDVDQKTPSTKETSNNLPDDFQLGFSQQIETEIQDDICCVDIQEFDNTGVNLESELVVSSVATISTEQSAALSMPAAAATSTLLCSKRGRPKLSTTIKLRNMKNMRSTVWKLQEKQKLLAARCENLQKRNRILNAKVEMYNIQQIEKDDSHGVFKASFLLEQLRAYHLKKVRFSEVVIRQCLRWRLKSPESYNFCRNTFLHLPSRETLRSYIGPSQCDAGVTSEEAKQLSEEQSLVFDEMCSFENGSPVFDEMSIKPKLK